MFHFYGLVQGTRTSPFSSQSPGQPQHQTDNGARRDHRYDTDPESPQRNQRGRDDQQRRPLERPGERRLWRGRGPEHVPAKKTARLRITPTTAAVIPVNGPASDTSLRRRFDQGAADQNEQERRQERENRGDRRSEDAGREELIRAQ